MTETKNKNGKNNVCRNDNNPSFLGVSSNPSFLGLTRESLDIRSESGKSMVEMLGVLALMGLLAVLGVKGYSMAMERATANRIVEEINRRSIVYSQQLLMTTSNTALNHSELATEIEGGYPVSGNRFGDDYFQIVVQKLPQNICARIGKLGYARAIQVLANGTALTAADQSACQTTGNVLTFTFTKDMTPCDSCLSGVKTCEGDGQCAINQVCQNGMCVRPVL